MFFLSSYVSCIGFFWFAYFIFSNAELVQSNTTKLTVAHAFPSLYSVCNPDSAGAKLLANSGFSWNFYLQLMR